MTLPKKRRMQPKRKVKAVPDVIEPGVWSRYLTWVGKPVHHLRYGNGIVTEAWGTFRSCSECFMPYPKYYSTKVKTQKGYIMKQFSQCHDARIATIPGAGVMDVEFGNGEMHSIHICNMTKGHKIEHH